MAEYKTEIWSNPASTTPADSTHGRIELLDLCKRLEIYSTGGWRLVKYDVHMISDKAHFWTLWERQ